MMGKKVWLLSGVVLLFSTVNGYAGLKFEKELAQKFCLPLQLHSGDQGASPKPVEIMSNKKVLYLNKQVRLS